MSGGDTRHFASSIPVIVPRVGTSRVGVVSTREGHLNAGENFITIGSGYSLRDCIPTVRPLGTLNISGILTYACRTVSNTNGAFGA